VEDPRLGGEVRQPLDEGTCRYEYQELPQRSFHSSEQLVKIKKMVYGANRSYRNAPFE